MKNTNEIKAGSIKHINEHISFSPEKIKFLSKRAREDKGYVELLEKLAKR